MAGSRLDSATPNSRSLLSHFRLEHYIREYALPGERINTHLYYYVYYNIITNSIVFTAATNFALFFSKFLAR